MPILAAETDLYPEDLLERADAQLQQLNGVADADGDAHQCWWALYTRSRHEKQLMRKLQSIDVPFYGPTIARRYRSPAGRLRTSYEPLFSNYVFIFGDNAQRHASLTTNCISRWFPVKDGRALTEDLQRIHRLILLGRPMTPESKLIEGDEVRVKTGHFAGFEGTVIRREGETRLLVAVRFMQQGASVLLDDCQLEPM